MMKETFNKMIDDLREIADYKGYKGSLYNLFIWQNYEQQMMFMYEYGLNTSAKREKFYKYLSNF